MYQWLLYAVNGLLLVAMIFSGIGWIRIIRDRMGRPFAEFVESILPSRIQDRPFRTNLDGFALFSTGLIMMLCMIVGFAVGHKWMVDRGMIDYVAIDPTQAAIVDAASDRRPAEPDRQSTESDRPPAETSTDSNRIESKAPDSESNISMGKDAIGNSAEPPMPSPLQRKHRTTDSLIASIALSALSGVFGILVSIGWLGLFFRQPFRISGLWPQSFDVGVGFRSALLILPPVLLISALSSQLVDYEHPVLNSMSDFAVPKVFLATVIGTALITPVVEEFMLRGLFQGGLQRLVDPPTPISLSTEDTPDPWRPKSFWPMVATSFLFAMMHLGQGAAPIPLFFLSLGLGYLYRQTGNLTAPILVHMVLNSLTLFVEFLKLNI